MNKIYWYITSFFALIIVFTLAYYASFQNSLKQYNSDQELQNLQSVSTEKENEAIVADGKLQERVQASTELVEEYYDVAEATYSDNKIEMPEEYVGCTREEVVQKITEYMKDVSKEDREKGLVSMNLVSFSKDSIHIRKVYDNKDNYQYYITVKDGYLVVYENDKETVVEVTDIVYDNLADSQKAEVDAGVYIGPLFTISFS